jgi:signal transduction histidine kinase
MSQELGHTLSALGQVGGWIEAALHQTGDAPGRALVLARMLQQLRPGAPLAACLLTGPHGPALAAVDGSGAERPDWLGPLRGDLLALAQAERPPAAGHVEVPQALGLAGHPLVPARAEAGGRCRGVLAVALPAGNLEAIGPVATLLGAAAAQLALRLEVEDGQTQVRALREELAVEGRAAVLGELSRPVTHEFNNFLNVLGLQLAVLEMELAPSQRGDLKEVRRHSTAMAALIRQFQRYRQQQAGPAPADLNEVIVQAVELLRAGRAGSAQDRPVLLAPAPGGAAVELHLAPDLPRVPAAAPELRRLCLFLLRNAAAAVDPDAGGAVTVRTEVAAGRVVARIEDNGPPIPPQHLPLPFEPNRPAREGTNALELAACRSMARRLDGTLEAENRPAGGVVMVLDLPAAPAA